MSSLARFMDHVAKTERGAFRQHVAEVAAFMKKHPRCTESRRRFMAMLIECGAAKSLNEAYKKSAGLKWRRH